MSARIFCDRCGRRVDDYWRNLRVEISRGSYASLNARYSSPEGHNWHVCSYCASELREWLKRSEAEAV